MVIYTMLLLPFGYFFHFLPHFCSFKDLAFGLWSQYLLSLCLFLDNIILFETILKRRMQIKVFFVCLLVLYIKAFALCKDILHSAMLFNFSVWPTYSAEVYSIFLMVGSMADAGRYVTWGVVETPKFFKQQELNWNSA